MAPSKADQPLFKTWTCCPKCGAKAKKRGTNPFRCSECHYTHFFSPCSAVGAIITDVDGQVLLLVRAKDPGKGMYGLPGGFVDPGETAEEALIREVREETQLKVMDYHYLVSYPNQYAYGGAILPVTDLFFAVTVRSFDKMKLQEGEIEAWHFCHPTSKELKNMAFESNRKALQMFLKLRKQKK
ncbi:MAG: NUDIX domain-containing protein [Planctomycetaceae bacterium]|nr:NUDIX domain-containing protein [Planctomycetaceae bacterium]